MLSIFDLWENYRYNHLMTPNKQVGGAGAVPKAISKAASNTPLTNIFEHIKMIPELPGAYYFPKLHALGLKNYFTYDNKIWGNMNPIYAKDAENKKRIEHNDKLLADYIGADKVYVMTAPPENTLINPSQEEHVYLQQYYKEKYINIRTNSVIIPRNLKNFHVVFAHSDCAIFVLVSKSQIVAMHIGAPQVLTGLHFDTLKLLNPEPATSIQAFVFPYICKKHYSIKTKKLMPILQGMQKTNPPRARLIKKHLGKRVIAESTGKNTKTERIYFDFIGLTRAEIKEFLKATYNTEVTFYETGLCTYEHATKYNNLFSYTAKKQGEQEPGTFNVGFGVNR